MKEGRHHIFAIIIATIGVFTSLTAAAQSLKPVEFNGDELALIGIRAEVSSARKSRPPTSVGADGVVGLYPGVGGITYNFRTGDSVYHIAADHVEPAVSTQNLGKSGQREGGENTALNALSTIGSEVIILSGTHRGERGRVIGKHGGTEHVMMDFPDKFFGDLTVDDWFQVMAIGAGMKLTNVEGVAVQNMSPDLMAALTKAGMGIDAKGMLHVGVTHTIPAKIMGSGLGRSQTYTGDYDIQLFDEQVVAEHGLDRLRFGDIVAIMDADSTNGRIYKTGAVTVGVVAHSRSPKAGHGPGVVTLFTSTIGNIRPVIDADANLDTLLDIR